VQGTERKKKTYCANQDFSDKIIPIDESCKMVNLEYIQMNIILTGFSYETTVDLTLQRQGTNADFLNADLLLFDVTFSVYRNIRGKVK